MRSIFKGDYDDGGYVDGDYFDQWIDVTFLQDFGPWKKGEVIDILAVTPTAFEEYDHLGHVVRSCEYIVTAK